MFLQTEELDSYFDEHISAYYDSSSPDGTQSSLASKNIVSERNRRKKLNERLEENSSRNIRVGVRRPANFEYEQEVNTFCSKPKRTRMENYYEYAAPRLMSSPIEVLELRVSNMGEKTIVVSLTCSKKTDTMVKLCEIFESLKLKVITANITAFSGRLLKTVFLEAEEEEKEDLRLKIEAAIAALNDPDSPMSI
ncbi:UNVERIFIED_CONTAM: Transcription factor [Sesamum calycinum]|uniref:Transcription factor n=1 Tax=Sesamum calycinum TaxID=2727403 RepID=A0AAW2NTN9_9LAMI